MPGDISKRLSASQTILDVFQDNVTRFANNRAFTCLGHSLTYRDLDRLSARFAAWLQTNTNLQPGDRIAIQLPNILQYPVALFGALRAGLVVVNTNPLYSPREVKHQLNDSGAKALVVLANVAASSASIIRETGVETVIVTQIADLHSLPKRLLINGIVKYVQKGVPPFSFPNQVSFRAALNASESALKPVTATPDDVAVLQYTGGTTGVAKGAMLTHSNLVSNTRQLADRMDETLQEGDKTYVAPLPLYHIYAFTIHCMLVLSQGNNNLLIPNPRDLDAFIKALKSEKVYGFIGLNTLFNALANHPEFKQLDFSELSLTASGGMALTSDTAKLWEQVTGSEPSEGYGLTETSPVVTSNPPNAIQPGTVGLPVVDTEVKVIDEEGKTLEQGEVGELCVRGPQVMKGYWQRPEATEKVLDSEGWFKTGDMAVIQEDGYIKIVDRKKDMILVSGFNVYPNELEDVISEHPDILEAGVIGMPDEKSGEVVKAFVVRKDPSLTEGSVVKFCKKNMAAYKVPKQVVFVDDLPKSAVGKILRRELKDKEPAEPLSAE